MTLPNLIPRHARGITYLTFAMVAGVLAGVVLIADTPGRSVWLEVRDDLAAADGTVDLVFTTAPDADEISRWRSLLLNASAASKVRISLAASVPSRDKVIEDLLSPRWTVCRSWFSEVADAPDLAAFGGTTLFIDYAPANDDFYNPDPAMPDDGRDVLWGHLTSTPQRITDPVQRRDAIFQTMKMTLIGPPCD